MVSLTRRLRLGNSPSWCAAWRSRRALPPGGAHHLAQRAATLGYSLRRHFGWQSTVPQDPAPGSCSSREQGALRAGFCARLGPLKRSAPTILLMHRQHPPTFDCARPCCARETRQGRRKALGRSAYIIEFARYSRAEHAALLAAFFPSVGRCRHLCECAHALEC